MNYHKGFIAPLLLALIALLIVGGGAYAYMQNTTSNQPTAATSTTQSNSKTPATHTAKGFSASPVSGTAPLTVNFGLPPGRFECPTGNLSCAAHQPTYSIDYGDRTPNASNLTHTYSVPGTYTASLSDNSDVKGAGGPFPIIATLIITVSGSNTSAISVPGMSQYTDTDFGFSFWYPNSWTVKSAEIKGSYVGGTVQKSLTISPPPNSRGLVGSNMTIDEFHSPTREITIPYDLCSPMSESFVPAHRYYFDVSAGTWMKEVDASTGHSGKDGSPYATATTTKAADVSNNTMGGLHLLSAGCAGEAIPLSAHNFLVFWYNRSDSPYYYDNLAKTIVATDSAVATPVSVAQQIQAITTEGILFGGLGTSIGNGWYTYNSVIYDHYAMPIVAADATSFKSVLFKGLPSGYAVDVKNVYGWNGVLAGADPATFSIVSGPDGNSSPFEKDKSHVWNEGKLIPGADASTFAIVVNSKQPGSTFFQKDATHVWDTGKLIPGADPATFSIVNQPLWQSALFETDSSHVWYDGKLIPGADPKTFVISTYNLTDNTALMRDANHSYELYNLLDLISSTTVRIDGGTPIPLL